MGINNYERINDLVGLVPFLRLDHNMPIYCGILLFIDIKSTGSLTKPKLYIKKAVALIYY
jgi:hypothetical protein